MTEIIVRRGSEGDIDRVMQIEDSSFGSEAYPKNFMLNLLSWCGDTFLVAEEDGELIGYACGFGEGESATIISIAVHPSWRGRGVAEGLLNCLTEKFMMKKVKEVSLQVDTGNVEAVSLYRKFGFEIVGKVKDYYRDGSDAYLMRRVF
ncbi:MAG: ribosomal protein S18-alanine N-acetyltransferase [Nitrososphaeria archaeon]|nr:ribosomal protein S18-alanine N-acetyltransferase [Nitrososphaeria archaeon]NIN51565.1 ribosomal protein S18-alanine N-acetyltransferase [Nitrososphaeria archaeon]NIQ32331.1 ribosomal protein S18-alanine N-acetyltransferase [Nitrososphaeria archaeon]